MEKGGLTRYKLNLYALTLFSAIALIVVGTDCYKMVAMGASDFSNASTNIIVALVSFFSGLSAAYTEQKKQEDNGK